MSLKQLKIVSMVQIDGKWVNQDDVPAEKFAEIVAKVMERAGNSIGATVQKAQKTA